MRYTLLVLLATCLHVCLGQNQKYCDTKLCSKYGQPAKPHIACPGVAKNNCPGDAREIPMTAQMKAYILDYHNKKRNELAGGNLPGYQSARRMPVVSWDDELAYVAGVNVKQCEYGHDKCRNTATFLWAGQNIAWTGGYPNDQAMIDYALDGWWGEYTDATQKDMEKYGQSGKMIGHFTQMSQDRMNKIGCAAMVYNRDERYVVCNYSITNIINQPVYVSGATASNCKTGRHSTYQNLCSEKEAVDPNPTF